MKTILPILLALALATPASARDIYVRLMGQSNASSAQGLCAEMPLFVEDANMFIWGTSAWVQYNQTTSCGSETSMLYRLRQIFPDPDDRLFIHDDAGSGWGLDTTEGKPNSWNSVDCTQDSWVGDPPAGSETCGHRLNDVIEDTLENYDSGESPKLNDGFLNLGLVWIQGERDASDACDTGGCATRHEANLRDFMNRWSVPVVIAEIHEPIRLLASHSPGGDTVLAAQRTVAGEFPHIATLPTGTTYEMQGDDIHYTSAGYWQLGIDAIDLLMKLQPMRPASGNFKGFGQ